jgi:hypothetical protein
LLVFEEDVDGGRREPGLISDLSQRAVVYSPLTEYLLGRVEDVDSVLAALGLPVRASLSPAVGLG